MKKPEDADRFSELTWARNVALDARDTTPKHEATAQAATDNRIGAIDLLKAVSIVAVVNIHCFLLLGENPRPKSLEVLGSATRFAVPAFLFAAGFLAARKRDERPRAFLKGRLQRLLIPYLVASFLTLLSGWGDTKLTSARNVAFALVFGSSWGPYYFVFVLATLTLVTPALVRLPRPVLGTAWLLLTFGAYWLERYPFAVGTFFWSVRHPLRWWGYYCAGMLATGLFRRLEEQKFKVRCLLAVCSSALCVTVLVLRVLAEPSSGAAAALQLGLIYATIAALITWGTVVPPAGFVTWLSDATYPIYLYHLFPARVLPKLVPDWPSLAARGRVFVASLLVSVLFVWIARRLLRTKARVLLG